MSIALSPGMLLFDLLPVAVTVLIFYATCRLGGDRHPSTITASRRR